MSSRGDSTGNPVDSLSVVVLQVVKVTLDHPLILWRGAAGGAPALRRKGLPQRARLLPRFLPLEREFFLATVASDFDQVRTRLHASVSFVAGLDCK